MKNTSLNTIEVIVLTALGLLLSKGFLGIVVLSLLIVIIKAIANKVTGKTLIPTKTLRNGFYAGLIVEIVKLVL